MNRHIGITDFTKNLEYDVLLISDDRIAQGLPFGEGMVDPIPGEGVWTFSGRALGPPRQC
jgi:hypothetical protein